MKLHEDTRKIQETLGNYCRTGGKLELPGLTPGRVRHYHRLVMNVVKDTLSVAFPITRAALPDSGWNELVTGFFEQGDPRTPRVWMLPLEFYRFHLYRESGTRLGLPWLNDLLLFEWMEIEVHTMPDVDPGPYVNHGKLLNDALVFNPEKRLLSLDYPVHLHPVEQASGMKGSWFVMLYRLPESGNVRFLDLSPLHVHILAEMEEREAAVSDLKAEIARISGIESEAFLDETLEKLLGAFMEKQLILGFKPTDQ